MTETELLMSKDFDGQNRGFGFAIFYNHAAANHAKKVLSAPNFKCVHNLPGLSKQQAGSVHNQACSSVTAKDHAALIQLQRTTRALEPSAAAARHSSSCIHTT